MRRRDVILGALALPACAHAQTPPRTFADEIDAYFRPLENAGDLSGALRVERVGEIEERRFGYADWAIRAPIFEHTQFPVGSIAKGVVVTVLLTLERDGLIDFSAPVGAHLPDYAHGGSMPVSRIIAHRAGLPRDVSDADFAAMGDGGFIGFLNAHPPTPTEERQYSNVGYEVLALIAERVSGQSFADLARARVFAPLGMQHSAIVSDIVGDQLATPHVPGPPPAEIRLARTTFIGPAGRMFASTRDLARWGRAVRDTEIADLKQPDGVYMGAVVARDLEGRPAIWMQGTVPGGGAVVSVFPGDDAVLVCAFNLETYPQFNAENVLTKIAFGQNPGSAPLRPVSTPLAEAHRALAGEYEVPGLGRARIHERDGEMTLTVLGPGWNFYMTPASEGRLVLRHFNYQFAPRRDENGALIGLMLRVHMLNDASAGETPLDKLA